MFPKPSPVSGACPGEVDPVRRQGESTALPERSNVSGKRRSVEKRPKSCAKAAQTRPRVPMSHVLKTLAPVLTALLVAASGSHATAQPIGSSYSSTAATFCWGTKGEKNVDDNTTRVCRGKVDLVVLVSQGGTPETISVGRDKVAAGNEPAAQAGFGAASSAVRSIEWRMAGSEPFAIIQRWRIADNDAAGKDGNPTDKPMLVVTRLPPGPVCHVA